MSKDERLVYEAPRAMRLGDARAGRGTCEPGTGDTEGCYGPGNAAAHSCGGAGNSATDTCYSAGNTPAIGCSGPGSGGD
jgi:hypothetical protein